MARLLYFRQPRVQGSCRDRLPLCVLREISHEVQLRADRYHVSRGWVISRVLAEAFGLTDEQPDFRTAFGKRQSAATAPARAADKQVRSVRQWKRG